MLGIKRAKTLLSAMSQTHVVVVGDVMLDQFIWGRVSRISPEAPVPVVEFDHESFMPGGAANVARNLEVLGASVSLFGLIGSDPAAEQLRSLFCGQKVGCRGLIAAPERMTTRKIRVIAGQQQVARVDRETRDEVSPATERKLWRALKRALPEADAVVVGDYGKGVVTQSLLEALKTECRRRAIWLSLDPKPVHALDLSRLSLITPNRKEAFELTGITDPASTGSPPPPLEDGALLEAAQRLYRELRPALLLITLGDQGMLLCQQGRPSLHIPTVAQEVFDVSGAGDTVIGSFTLAIAAGGSPQEAAFFANHAAGAVVGKIGTATVSPEEWLASFGKKP